SACPDDYMAAFVTGTEPRETCDQQSGVAGFFSRIFGGTSKPVTPTLANGQDKQDPNKKKGFFGKIADIFKDDKSSTPPKTPANSQQPAPQ
ncbi:MAG: hypothetical protein WAK21_10915, partial [Candidatus Sulfotelmatobacter sp.]